MLASKIAPRAGLWHLQQALRPAAGAVVFSTPSSRSFGRHPKHDPRIIPADKPLPSVKDLTEALIKTPKRKEWLRQPFPYKKDDSKDERRDKRDVYLYQRTLPAPVVSTVLHGCHTKLHGDATIRRWWFIDAQGQVPGKLAAKIVKVIMGKHKPIYDRSQNLGDFVVVTNAEKVAFTGKKREQKVYRYHTGWPGGLVTTPLETMYEKKPEEVLRRAIAGMLPKNTLRRERLKLLRIFAGEKHPHSAEDLTPLPDNIVKVASPWLIVKERESVEVQTDNWWVDENGAPWPELVDNHGKKWTVEEAEDIIKTGNVVFRDPELFGKDVAEPRTDTQGGKWKKD
mmetsp:Transcript_88423/g.143172  ORF Transcript_88423/g.143172 Transcript_88423/m.143172 type:complete len:340 (+) Transcript_88423:83-1102(+)